MLGISLKIVNQFVIEISAIFIGFLANYCALCHKLKLFNSLPHLGHLGHLGLYLQNRKLKESPSSLLGSAMKQNNKIKDPPEFPPKHKKIQFVHPKKQSTRDST